MKTRTWIILAVAAAAATAGIWTWLAMGSGTPVRVAEAQIGPIEQFVVERGKTRLPNTYLITMPLTGRIEPIEFEEDTPVEKGQIVASMVPLDLELDVDEATASVGRLKEAIKENLQDNVEQTGLLQAEKFVVSMRETVKAAYERVRSGEAEYNYALKNYGRIEPLTKAGAKTEEDLDQAELLKVQSEADLRQDELVHSAMSAMEAATNLLPQMIQQYIGNKRLSDAVLQKQLAEAEARRRRIIENQRRGTMRSPIDGIVLKRFVSDEQYLQAGTRLLELGRLEDLEVEADILTLDVVDVVKGDPVILFGPAVGLPRARGTVTRIYPAGFTKISSLGVEQQRVKVIVRFDPEDLKRLLGERHLEVGYRVQVKIITDRKSQALVIPRTALFRSDQGTWQVFSVRGGRAELTKVMIGLMNDEWAEVTKGLGKGDCVVIAPDSNLEDGGRVTAEKVDRPLAAE